MSEIRHNEIIYEEGWHESVPAVNAVQEETPVDEAPPAPDTPKEKGSRPLLMTLQLIVCLLAALVLFLLKSMDSEGYHAFMDYYRDELQKPLISQGVFDTLNEGLFGTQVTTEATPDAVSPR